MGRVVRTWTFECIVGSDMGLIVSLAGSVSHKQIRYSHESLAGAKKKKKRKKEKKRVGKLGLIFAVSQLIPNNIS